MTIKTIIIAVCMTPLLIASAHAGPGWQYAAPMPNARYGHDAVVGKDGDSGAWTAVGTGSDRARAGTVQRNGVRNGVVRNGVGPSQVVEKKGKCSGNGCFRSLDSQFLG